MPALCIVYRNPADLVPRVRNSRKHSAAQISRLALSIAAFGFVEPVIIDRSDQIIVGNARTKAAIKQKLEAVPTILIEDMTPEQMRAYCIASNRLAELSEWDDELLAIELGELDNLELDFDLTSIGFDTADIDRILGTFDTGDGEPDPGRHSLRAIGRRRPATRLSCTKVSRCWQVLGITASNMNDHLWVSRFQGLSNQRLSSE